MTGADQKPYSGWQTNADELEDAMRLAFGLINSLAALTLSLTAACGANALTNEWTLDVRSGSDSAPAVGTDGTIYFGTWLGKLWAVNPDGSRKWVFQAQNEIKSAPAVGSDGTVYFGSRDRKFYALAPDGHKKWEFATDGPIVSSPALNSGATRETPGTYRTIHPGSVR